MQIDLIKSLKIQIKIYLNLLESMAISTTGEDNKCTELKIYATHQTKTKKTYSKGLRTT